MPTRTGGSPISFLRRMLPFLTVMIVIAAAYDGWIFYSRWHDARETARNSEMREAEDARKTLDMLGGDQLKIMTFYASPATIHRGQRANLCYGVNGAASVRIEPAVESLHPALEYCLQVSPAATTEYNLVAQDRSGHTASRQFVLHVAP